MRLIDTRTLELCEFTGDEITEEYAILSHRWEDEEVTFQDWQVLSIAKEKKGFAKIDMACKQAQKHGLNYLWADTNCINKTSSAELNEALNSMFTWYQRSAVCYAYLSDVEPLPGGFDNTNQNHIQQFSGSKWFTRGWTLQELLAPVQLTFYSRDWWEIAPRSTVVDIICEVTKIDTIFLYGNKMFQNASTAQKMSWVSRRETKRVEDMAYCMLGIFDVHMPLIYGEGLKSFTRLQEEIIRTSNDQSIFCWTWTTSVPAGWVSLLAPCPQAFQHSGGFLAADSKIFNRTDFKVTNSGLSITLPIVRAWSYCLGILNVSIINGAEHGADRLICIPIDNHWGTSRTRRRVTMRRLQYPPGPLPISPSWTRRQLPMYIWSIPGPRVALQYPPGPLPVSPSWTRRQLPMYIWSIPGPRLVHCPLTPAYTPSDEEKYSFLLCFDHLPKFCLQPSETMDSSNSNPSVDPRNSSSGIHVFPPFAFDRAKSLITINRTSSSSGALIRLERDGKTCTLFLGLSFRFNRPYRFCGIVSELGAKDTRDEQEILKRSLDSVANECNEEVPFRLGLTVGIIMGEETITTAGSIYLVYITSDYMRTSRCSEHL